MRRIFHATDGGPISPVQAGMLVFCLCLFGVLVGLSWIRELTARVRADAPAVHEQERSNGAQELP